MPETSIIIRTFNEEKHLPRLLEAIRTQDYQDFEIVNVDSGSFDLTRVIAERSCDRLVQVGSPDFTFGYSLNEGIRASSGRYVVCISAHAEPTHRHWLERLVAPLAAASTAMVYGRQLGSPAYSKFGETQDFRRTFGDRRLVMRPPNFFANNANSAVRRDLWKLHPFDEALTGLEDIEFAKYWMSRGLEVIYEPDAPVYHLHQESWRQVRRRYFYEAVAAKAMGLRSRSTIPGEIAVQARRLAGDLLRGLGSGQLPGKIGEIVLFRYNKAVGTARGLWTTPPGPEQREELLFDRTSKAVVIRGARHAVLEDRPTPRMKPGDVLVKVAYVGVCHTDIEVLNGTLGYYRRGLGTYPIVPGHEYAGRVVGVGSNVTDVSRGDAVVAETLQGCGECDACRDDNIAACQLRTEVGVFGHDGAYAEYVVVSARSVHRLPEGTDLQRATLIEPLSVVMRALRRAGDLLAQGPRCAVVGAGPIGHLAALVLSHKGHDVTVIEPHAERRALIERPGILTLAEMPTGGDFDLWVEATGDARVLSDVFERSRAQSTILLLGLPYGPRPFNFARLVSDEKTMVGSVGATRRDVQAAVDILPQMDLGPLTSHVLALADFHKAWESAKNREHLKTLLEVDSLLNESAGSGRVLERARG